ncbi:hypothetical protein, partial [Acidithiobacillus thiooxidans]|uniref:hypothetical protein n=1 Tax=Acidithiobacillus thiooxidans TaxID=930 RepID=UPI001A7E1B37
RNSQGSTPFIPSTWSYFIIINLKVHQECNTTLGTLAAADAQQQLTSDGFNQRLERIERRLELS